MCGLFAYLWKNIIRPFGRLNDVPQELARGNLAVPIAEEKSSFFGKFTWDVNLLREKIEDDPQSPSIILTVRGMGYKAVDK